VSAAGRDAVCIIGAGSSGLAALRALHERGVPVVGFERGSDVGGNWRYENDNGVSAAYASLRCNVSRRRMQYRALPMPASYGDYPDHRAMAAYFSAYADAFRLRPLIRFSTTVERVTPAPDGTFDVLLHDGARERFGAVVVANGHHWAPVRPDLPGTTTAAVMHAHDYRTPDAFAGRRVLIVGAGQSAIEIATETSRIAARTVMSVRSGVHVIPRYLLGRPIDYPDTDLTNRLPWPFLNRLMAALLRASRWDDPAAYGLPRPAHRVLDQTPAVSSDLAPALRAGAIAVRPGVARVDGACVQFSDGTTEMVDHIVLATGYRISFPFLSPALLRPDGMTLPLYRRIVPPEVPGLYFIGLVDAPTGLLPVVERQSAWLADVLTGRLALPDRATMHAAADAAEPRTRERFPREHPHSIRCDPHAYLRTLARDRRRGRVRRLARAMRTAIAVPGLAQASSIGTSPRSS
jgi:cation diffusion facilitator CzcD-associated flavoprotein CzcO